MCVHVNRLGRLLSRKMELNQNKLFFRNVAQLCYYDDSVGGVQHSCCSEFVFVEKTARRGSSRRSSEIVAKFRSKSERGLLVDPVLRPGDERGKGTHKPEAVGYREKKGKETHGGRETEWTRARHECNLRVTSC